MKTGFFKLTARTNGNAFEPKVTVQMSNGRFTTAQSISLREGDEKKEIYDFSVTIPDNLEIASVKVENKKKVEVPNRIKMESVSSTSGEARIYHAINGFQRIHIVKRPMALETKQRIAASMQAKWDERKGISPALKTPAVKAKIAEINKARSSNAKRAKIAKA